MLNCKFFVDLSCAQMRFKCWPSLSKVRTCRIVSVLPSSTQTVDVKEVSGLRCYPRNFPLAQLLDWVIFFPRRDKPAFFVTVRILSKHCLCHKAPRCQLWQRGMPEQVWLQAGADYMFNSVTANLVDLVNSSNYSLSLKIEDRVKRQTHICSSAGTLVF